MEIDIQNLRNTRRAGATKYPVDEWVSEIRENGVVAVPVYHNQKEHDDEYKSTSVRKWLAKSFGTIFFAHALTPEDRLVLIVSRSKTILEDAGLDYAKEVEGDY
jgi:hypothetical protein